jgi:MoaA/NifB/PqqE/SkfB family radical SAM enzyme
MPWYGLTLAANGNVKPCCQLKTREREGDKQPKSNSILDQYNSPRIQEVRQSFLDGEEHQDCGSCWSREDTVGASRRTWFNDKFKKYVDTSIELTTNVEDPQWVQADINLSNVCNLKCRMCGSWASNAWFEEEEILRQIDRRYKRARPQQATLRQFGLSDLEEILPNLKNTARIDFKGGEPMLAKHHNQFLQWLIDEGLTKINLFYTTNGTVRNPTILKMLSNFENVTISFSIEGTGSLYSYIRGGKYTIDDLEETIAQYNEMDNVKMCFNVSLQNYNVLDLHNIHALLQSFDAKYKNVSAKSAFTTVVNEPTYLSPLNIPEDIKNIVIDNLTGIPDFDNYVNKLKNRTFDENEWEVFCNFTADLDILRSETIKDIIPEFVPYMDTLNQL